MFSEKELTEAGIPREHHKTANTTCELIIFGSILFFLTWALWG